MGDKIAGTHLYLIASDAGQVKIGRSADPRNRFLTLRTSSPAKLVMVKILRNRGHEEFAIHRKLRSHRTRGEWFRDTEHFRSDLAKALGVTINFQRDPIVTEEEERLQKRSAMDKTTAAVCAEIRAEGEARKLKSAARFATPRHTNA